MLARLRRASGSPRKGSGGVGDARCADGSPWHERPLEALEAPFDRQLDALEHEAGVRQQL